MRDTIPEAAHAASEFDTDRPTGGTDDGMHMLGWLIAIGAGLALGGVAAGFILAVLVR